MPPLLQARCRRLLLVSMVKIGVQLRGQAAERGHRALGRLGRG